MAIKVSGIIVIDDNKNLANINTAVFQGNNAIKIPIGTTAQRPAATPGLFRYNTDLASFEGYSSSWGAIGGSGGSGGGGLGGIQTISSNTTAVSGNLYVLTANLTLTLPSSPSGNNMIGVSNQSGYANSKLARNGSNIMGLAEDMNIDVVSAGFEIIYSNSAYGWVIV